MPRQQKKCEALSSRKSPCSSPRGGGVQIKAEPGGSSSHMLYRLYLENEAQDRRRSYPDLSCLDLHQPRVMGCTLQHVSAFCFGTRAFSGGRGAPPERRAQPSLNGKAARDQALTYTFCCSERNLPCRRSRNAASHRVDVVSEAVDQTDGDAELLFEVAFAGARIVGQQGVG
jgi:hypothetical protein